MKLEEKHTYQCDICEKVRFTDSSNPPTGWFNAILQLDNGYCSTRYVVCRECDGNKITWIKKRKNIFQRLFFKTKGLTRSEAPECGAKGEKE